MKITLDNFQSIGHAEIDVEGLTVIVGPSDRGKSALVRAVDGALFNKSGDQFVREGAEFTVVTLRWEVGLDAGHHMVGHQVTWQKGGGKNNFRIDGELFDKVGTKAPEALQVLGFKDVLIGARVKEDNSTDGGEWVRPQVAGQFDGIFLLDKPGTFLNEVIVKLSRLGVLQRAERQCASDVRQTKSLLTLRQKDLMVATTAAEKLASAPLLRTRLEQLLVAEQLLTARTAVRDGLREWVPRRVAALRRAAITLPPKGISAEAVTEVKEQYEQLLDARLAILQRAALAALPKKLPKPHKSIKPLELAQQRWQALQDGLGRLEIARVNVDTAQRAGMNAEAALVAARFAIVQFMDQNPTCPVCAQPWPVAAGV